MDESDRVIDQKVEYEWKPVLCTTCHLFGHEAAECRHKKEPKKQWVPKQVQQQPDQTEKFEQPEQAENTDGWQTVTRKRNKGKGVQQTGGSNANALPTDSPKPVESGSLHTTQLDHRKREELVDKGSSHG